MTVPFQNEIGEVGEEASGVIASDEVILLKADIDEDCYSRLSEALTDIGFQERLALVLESLGGSIEWAFWIAKALREHCRALDVVIPSNAKSAATLIALAADRILMGRRGELGPLDQQRRDPAGGAMFRSPLETIQGLQYLRRYYQESIDDVMLHLISSAGMDIPFALEQTPNVLAPAITPLYQNVNVRELGDAYRALLVGERYAKEAMRRWSPITEIVANQVVEALVWDYPDHGHIIDLDEAHRIGLQNAIPLETAHDVLFSRIVQYIDPTVNVIDLAELVQSIAAQRQEGDFENAEINYNDQECETSPGDHGGY